MANRLHMCFILFLVSGFFLVDAGSSCFAYELIDDDNRLHRFDKPFEKIISLYPAHTENLVEMGATDLLIGISASDTLVLPAGADGIRRFSHRGTAEMFIAAAPDCILIRPMISHSAPNLIKKLREYGITVISLQPTSSSELYEYWQKLGLISGRISESARMVSNFQARVDKLNKKVAGISAAGRPRVYFEAIHARMKTFAPRSIAMFCLSSAGGTNIATDAVARRQTNIAAYGKERILAHAAEIDFYLAQSGRMNRIRIEDIIGEPGFGAIKAVRERMVYLVPEDLVSRPTTRLIEGMLYIHSLLYQNSLQ